MNDTQLLIIDDEEFWVVSVRMLIARKLKIKNILSCTDSRAAMEILENMPVSCILLDYSMPHISGLELLKWIKKKKPRIPVVIISARNPEEYVEQIENLGVTCYVNKSAGPEKILNEIKKALLIPYLPS